MGFLIELITNTSSFPDMIIIPFIFGIFGDLGDFLFGEEQEIKSSSVSNLTPKQRALLDQLLGIVSPRVEEPVTPFPGQLVADTTEMESLFQSFAGGAVDERSKQLDVINKALEGTLFGPESTREQITAMDPIFEQAYTESGEKIAAFKGGKIGFSSSGTERRLEDAFGEIGAAKATYAAEAWKELGAANREVQRQAMVFAGQERGEFATMLEGFAKFDREIMQRKLEEDILRFSRGEAVDGVSDIFANPALQFAFSLLGLNTLDIFQAMTTQDTGALRDVAVAAAGKSTG